MTTTPMPPARLSEQDARQRIGEISDELAVLSLAGGNSFIKRDVHLASAVDRMKARLRAERVEIEARLFELA